MVVRVRFFSRFAHVLAQEWTTVGQSNFFLAIFYVWQVVRHLEHRRLVTLQGQICYLHCGTWVFSAFHSAGLRIAELLARKVSPSLMPHYVSAYADQRNQVTSVS